MTKLNFYLRFPYLFFLFPIFSKNFSCESSDPVFYIFIPYSGISSCEESFVAYFNKSISLSRSARFPLSKTIPCKRGGKVKKLFHTSKRKLLFIFSALNPTFSLEQLAFLAAANIESFLPFPNLILPFFE